MAEFHAHLDACAREYLSALIGRHDSMRAASVEAGLHLSSLYRLLDQHGLRRINRAPRRHGNAEWLALGA